MDANHISGAAFKKMIVKANSPHAKYVPSAVKKAINDMHLFKHVHEGAHVSKQTAKQIMHKMKDRGLAGHMKKTVDRFVSEGFRQEKRRTEMIKKQNLDTRRQEIAAEKTAEMQKQSGQAANKNKPVASALQGGAMRSSWAAAATTSALKKSVSGQAAEKSASASTRIASALTNGPLKKMGSTASSANNRPQTIKPGSAATTPKPDDEIIDLAID